MGAAGELDAEMVGDRSQLVARQTEKSPGREQRAEHRRLRPDMPGVRELGGEELGVERRVVGGQMGTGGDGDKIADDLGEPGGADKMPAFDPMDLGSAERHPETRIDQGGPAGELPSGRIDTHNPDLEEAVTLGGVETRRLGIEDSELEHVNLQWLKQTGTDRRLGTQTVRAAHQEATGSARCSTATTHQPVRACRRRAATLESDPRARREGQPHRPAVLPVCSAANEPGVCRYTNPATISVVETRVDLTLAEVLEPRNRRERLGRLLASLFKIPQLPPHVESGLLPPPDRSDDKRWVSSGRIRWALQHMIVWESLRIRNRAWNNIETKVILGMVCIVLSVPVILLIAAWSTVVSAALLALQGVLVLSQVVVSYLIDVDRDRFNQAVSEHGELLGLAAAGGFGIIPAQWLTSTQTRETVWDREGEPVESLRATLERLGLRRWFNDQGLDQDQLEVLETLSGEYDGTLGELVQAARLLGC
jgi:predicted outer membrane lipoprotein